MRVIGGFYVNNKGCNSISIIAEPSYEYRCPDILPSGASISNAHELTGTCARIKGFIQSLFSFRCIFGDRSVSYVKITLPVRQRCARNEEIGRVMTISQYYLCNRLSLDRYQKEIEKLPYGQVPTSLFGREITIRPEGLNYVIANGKIWDSATYNRGVVEQMSVGH